MTSAHEGRAKSSAVAVGPARMRLMSSTRRPREGAGLARSGSGTDRSKAGLTGATDRSAWTTGRRRDTPAAATSPPSDRTDSAPALRGCRRRGPIPAPARRAARCDPRRSGLRAAAAARKPPSCPSCRRAGRPTCCSAGRSGWRCPRRGHPAFFASAVHSLLRSTDWPLGNWIGMKRNTSGKGEHAHHLREVAGQGGSPPEPRRSSACSSLGALVVQRSSAFTRGCLPVCA